MSEDQRRHVVPDFVRAWVEGDVSSDSGKTVVENQYLAVTATGA